MFLIPTLAFSAKHNSVETERFRPDRRVLLPLFLYSLSQLLVAFSLGVVSPTLSIYLSDVVGVEKDGVGFFLAS